MILNVLASHPLLAAFAVTLPKATKIACLHAGVTMEQWIREALEAALREKRRAA